MNRLVIIRNRFNKVIILRTFVIILLFFLTFGCVARLNKTSTFTIYKEPPIKNGEKICVRIDGAYVSSYDSYFFYSNGLVKMVFINSSYISNYNWNSKQKIKEPGRFDDYKEFWGHYKCYGNGITMQIFNYHHQEFYKRQIIEKKIKIIKDSTLSLYSSTWKSEENLMKEERVLNFYKITSKPDSTRVWFINKDWYKENVYYNK